MKKQLNNNQIDMLHGPLSKSIIAFALPIALSGILQQLFNSADTAVVGRFANSNALAAVGTNGEIVALIVSLSAGLSVGANVLIANYIGSEQTERIPNAVRISWLIALIFGIGLALIGQVVSMPLMEAIHVPEEILTSATLYLKLYTLGCPFLMLYDFGSAMLRAIGDSRRPLFAMFLSGIINVILNLIFVIRFHLEVAGVALATMISTAFSAALVIYWVCKEPLLTSKDKQILPKEASSVFMHILIIGMPAALQGAVFCFANIFVQAAINGFGAIAVAGSSIAVNFEYFTYYMITSFGQAATTFTGQNYAAGNIRRCREIARKCILLSFLFCASMTVPLTIFREQAAGLFSTNPAVIEAACIRILSILMVEPFCAGYETISGSLRGMGHSSLPALEVIFGICILRLCWLAFAFPQLNTLRSLFIIFPINWGLTTILLYISFRRIMRAELKNSARISISSTYSLVKI